MSDECAGEYKRFTRELRAALFPGTRERQAGFAETFDELAILWFLEKLDDALSDARADFVDFLKFFQSRLHERVHRSEMFR